MLYPFMTLNDDTEITHSEIINEGGREKVKVVFEKPIIGGFKHAECWLPDYKWENIDGYSDLEIEELLSMVKDLSAVIIDLARKGGFENVENF